MASEIDAGSIIFIVIIYYYYLEDRLKKLAAEGDQTIEKLNHLNNPSIKESDIFVKNQY